MFSIFPCNKIIYDRLDNDLIHLDANTLIDTKDRIDDCDNLKYSIEPK